MQTGGLGSVIGGAGVDPEQTFSLGIRNGRNARMSGPSIEQADSGWHLG
jgi:hypothetical protein